MSIMREMGDLRTPPGSRPEEPNSLRLWSSNNNFRKTSMNVAIVGSRSFKDYARLTKCIAEVLADRKILMSEVQVISGDAVGVDALAERYSREILGKEAHIFAADRKQFGRSAGPKRNNEIVEAADLVIAFPGKGRGTWNTIYLAWKKGIPVEVFPIR
jgi:hypothetical protein